MRLTFSIKQPAKRQQQNYWECGGSRGMEESVSHRDSSNSVKHFTYLHINWLKRKYMPARQTLAHSRTLLSVSTWQRTKGSCSALYTPCSASFYHHLCLFLMCFSTCLFWPSLSSTHLRLFLFGNFWHFKCVWLFSFWSASCEVIHWLSSDSVEALTTSVHTFSQSSLGPSHAHLFECPFITHSHP